MNTKREATFVSASPRSMGQAYLPFYPDQCFEMDGVQVFATNARTRKVIRDVWASIPQDDRAVIATRLEMIVSHPHLVMDSSSGRRSLAWAGARRVHLTPVPRDKECAVARSVFAHELAHVFHDHTYAGLLAKDDLLVELEADDTALRWGYANSGGAVSFACAYYSDLIEGKAAENFCARPLSNYTAAQELVARLRSEMAVKS